MAIQEPFILRAKAKAEAGRCGISLDRLWRKEGLVEDAIRAHLGDMETTVSVDRLHLM